MPVAPKLTSLSSEQSGMKWRSSTNLHDVVAATNFYEERYKRGYMDEWPKEKCEQISQLLKELPLPPTGRALDFGCGTGVFTAMLRDTLTNWEVEGTDLSVNAIKAARMKLPGCSLYPLAECRGRVLFDLIFTHHVLEHVSNLAATARLLEGLAKPASTMFHILPCADEGSFEHMVSLLRTDGIRTDGEPRFFYEEEGHLRRLETARLAELWAPDRFRLKRAWYARHTIGAVESLTKSNWGHIWSFADPKKGINATASRKLALIRLGLVALWTLRRPVTVIGYKRKSGCRGARDFLLLGASLLAYPVAGAVDASARFLARREWDRRRSEPGGSEMYVFLARL
jgi:SAM-dependent methyltransferase